jgi:4-amino-4-deoxy-L-arabinose transferase-like glycosyltransferase
VIRYRRRPLPAAGRKAWGLQLVVDLVLVTVTLAFFWLGTLALAIFDYNREGVLMFTAFAVVATIIAVLILAQDIRGFRRAPRR